MSGIIAKRIYAAKTNDLGHLSFAMTDTLCTSTCKITDVRSNPLHVDVQSSVSGENENTPLETRSLVQVRRQAVTLDNPLPDSSAVGFARRRAKIPTDVPTICTSTCRIRRSASWLLHVDVQKHYRDDDPPALGRSKIEKSPGNPGLSLFWRPKMNK